MSSFGDQYLLSAGRSDHDRLRQLCEIHDPQTHTLLAQAGLAPGKRYVEFACGLGYVARHAARQGAQVTAIDLSADHLQEAARLAAEEGLTNIEFRNDNIYSPGIAPNSFDIAYCRWILVHLRQPVDALHAIYSVLAPGGVVVCEEPDVCSLQAEPECAAYPPLRDYIRKSGAARGVDYQGGRDLHRWVQEAGFELVSAKAYMNHYLNGPYKAFWTWTYAATIASTVELGVVTQAQADDILRGLQASDNDPSVWTAHARNYQVIARKPL